MRNFRPLRNALDTFDAGDLHDFEEGLRAALAHRAPSQAVGAVDAKPEQASGEIVGYFCEDTGDFMSLKSYTWQVENVRPLDGYVAVIRQCREPKPSQAVGVGDAGKKYEARELLEVADELDEGQFWKAAEMLRYFANPSPIACRAADQAVATAGDEVTDEQVRECCERHEIFSLGSHLTDARAAFEDAQSLASPSAPRVGVPEGWKLVPVETTVEMRESWMEANCSADAEWAAMLAAAPEVPK
jgi:hypothetical protein